MKTILISCLLLVFPIIINAQQIYGKVLVNAQCASGGTDYYFYSDKTVIGVCINCESQPFVQMGQWQIKDNFLNIYLTKQWEGIGVGKPIEPCASVCFYNKYKASFKEITEIISLEKEIFLDDYKPQDCSFVKAFNETKADISKYLKTNFSGNYPEASERLLTESELKKLNKKQLKIMRNEIFARYGYIFKSSEMSEYFNNQEKYLGTMDDVDAFLTDIEITNIKLIKSLEKK